MHTQSPAASMSFLLTPSWPYALGAASAAALAATTIATPLLATGKLPSTAAPYVFVGAIVASALLGIAWLGLIRHGVGAVLAALGCFALAGALGMIYAHRDASADALGAMLTLGLAALALGIACVPRTGPTRIFAAVAAAAFALELVGPARLVEFGAFVTLVAALVALPFSLYALRRRARYAFSL